MTKEDLDRFEHGLGPDFKDWQAITFHGYQDCKDLIRLARLGLWAQEHALPALNEYRFISVTKGETQYSAAAEAIARFPKEAK